MKMNKWMMWVFAAIIAVGIGWFVADRKTVEPRNAASAVATQRPAAEQALVDAVLESPERLDAPVVESAKPVREEPVPLICMLPTGKERHLLSDIEKPPSPQRLKEPVAAESLYFWKDYASLRKDAIRNPDSPENRAGVVSLMQARQRRLGQTN